MQIYRMQCKVDDLKMRSLVIRTTAFVSTLQILFFILHILMVATISPLFLLVRFHTSHSDFRLVRCCEFGWLLGVCVFIWMAWNGKAIAPLTDSNNNKLILIMMIKKMRFAHEFFQLAAMWLVPSSIFDQLNVWMETKSTRFAEPICTGPSDVWISYQVFTALRRHKIKIIFN